MYFKRDKQSMAAKRPVRQRRGGSKVSPKKKRQLFLPESSGRTSCLVMSAVPPELPEVSGRSRAPISAALVTLGFAAHLLAAECRVQFAAPGCSFAHWPARGSQLLPRSLERPECVTFPDPCFSVILKIAQQHRFVNRLFAEKRLNSAGKNDIIYPVIVCALHKTEQT